jgi:hypothetical protein
MSPPPATPRSFFVYYHKLIPVTGWDMHHIIHKQSMYNEVRTLVFHENSLFTVDRWVSVPLHPFQDVNVQSSGCSFGSIDAFEKQDDMATNQADEYIPRRLPCLHRWTSWPSGQDIGLAIV